MSILLLLTGLALAGFAIGILALVWSIRAGQFDDLETPALRVLGDDPRLRSAGSTAIPTPIPRDPTGHP